MVVQSKRTSVAPFMTLNSMVPLGPTTSPSGPTTPSTGPCAGTSVTRTPGPGPTMKLRTSTALDTFDLSIATMLKACDPRPRPVNVLPAASQSSVGAPARSMPHLNVALAASEVYLNCTVEPVVAPSSGLGGTSVTVGGTASMVNAHEPGTASVTPPRVPRTNTW